MNSIVAIANPDGVIAKTAINGIDTYIGLDIVKHIVAIAQINNVVLAVAINIIVMGRGNNPFNTRQNIACGIAA